MQVQQQSHTISKTEEGLLYEIKSKDVFDNENSLYLYFTPSITDKSPFDNCRFKKVFKDRDVVVFDYPSFKNEDTSDENLDSLISRLEKLFEEKFDAEGLKRIDDKLTNNLKKYLNHHEFDNQPVNAKNVASKLAFCIVMMLKLLKMDSNLEKKPSSIVHPKEVILKECLEEAKDIKYILEESPEKILLTSQGLEAAFTLLFADLELIKAMAAGETNENLQKILETNNKDNIEFKNLKSTLDEAVGSEKIKYLDLANKLSQYMKDSKKHLVVYEGVPLVELLRTFMQYLNSDKKISIKGPIKEPIGCFWKLKDAAGHKAYLLGSIHLVPDYLLDLNSKIRRKFQKSQGLAVERDITRQDVINEAKADMLNELKVFQDEAINALTPEQKKKAHDVLSKIYPDLAMGCMSKKISQEQFIFLALKDLQAETFKKMHIASGIDLKLIEEAKERQLPIEDLETQESHKAFAQLPEIKEDGFNKVFIAFLDQIPLNEDTKTMIEKLQAWMANDLEQSLSKICEPWEEGDLTQYDGSVKDSLPMRQQMISRNFNMAMKICDLMKSGKRYFFVAGVGHTAGKMSIQDFLEQFKIKAERV